MVQPNCDEIALWAVQVFEKCSGPFVSILSIHGRCLRPAQHSPVRRHRRHTHIRRRGRIIAPGRLEAGAGDVELACKIGSRRSGEVGVGSDFGGTVPGDVDRPAGTATCICQNGAVVQGK